MKNDDKLIKQKYIKRTKRILAIYIIFISGILLSLLIGFAFFDGNPPEGYFDFQIVYLVAIFIFTAYIQLSVLRCPICKEHFRTPFSRVYSSYIPDQCPHCKTDFKF